MKRLITVLLTTTIILLFVTSSVFALGDVSVEVADRYGFAEVTLDDGAIVQYIGDLNTTYGASGSGIFNPFVRLQGNEKKSSEEKGYNTDGTREWDTKAGNWTHSILLSEIPTIMVGPNLYWEFWSDINDSDSTPLISLDDFELYLTSDPSLTGYPFTGTAEKIYDYTSANDPYYILINDVNQGSGRGDLRYLVPVSDTGVENCNYGNPACTTYLVLYSVWGGKGDPYNFDGGFEEWKVKKYPILQVSKNVYGAYDTPVSWEITKEKNGAYDLFAGESVIHGYQVSVNPIFGKPENTLLFGTITILGDSKDDVNASLTDTFNGTPANITGCSVPMNVDGTYPIASGATVTCSYTLDLDAPLAGTNLARASYTMDSVALGFEGHASILVNDYVETLTGNPDIDVIDTNGKSWSASAASATWTYTRDFTCPTDTSLYVDGFHSFTHDNTATITQTEQSDDASVTINCYAPVVEKTTETYWNRDWDWTIEKNDDADYHLFAGDMTKHTYRVSVTPTYTDNFWGVKGNIYVYNNHPSANMTLESISDLAGGFTADVTCLSLVVPAQGSLTCEYNTGAQASPNNNPFGATNIATAVFADADWTGQKLITFSDVPTTEDEPIITIDDDNLTGEIWSANRFFEDWTYQRDFSCPTDLSQYVDGVLQLDDHVNTATINETGQYDQATVQVTCYALLVSKDAYPSFTRTYHWTIQKDVNNPGPITVPQGGSVDVMYTVTADLALTPYVDSEWAVKGTISINNPAPMAASLSSVTDTIAPDIAAAVECPGMTIAAGGLLKCTYSAGLKDAAFRTNTATATLAEIGTSFSGSANVDFTSAAITEVDEMVDVTDSYANYLGMCTADDAPCTFSYPRTIFVEDTFCGTVTVDNTATLTTIDTGYQTSDNASVIIEVPCEGCTPGFWQGGAGVQLWDEWLDPQWVYVGDQPFYTQDVFNTIFAVVVDSRLAGQTMWQLVSNEGGIANSAEKAARSMVAAYLNESAFPDTFPADSLDQLEADWYAAVAGGDAALEAFHIKVAAWNNPESPGYCPLP